MFSDIFICIKVFFEPNGFYSLCTFRAGLAQQNALKGENFATDALLSKFNYINFINRQLNFNPDRN